ncbi:hypothetical protein HLB23_13950 [Nocardia uniformis]|uniref:Uncharacterized protein n=1 Tax=Nocardia uniformis TaxID=53432 RepID=A0A849CD22_9NOCA|nr:hypothetical protein [Nocardia uniformis]NNH70951.1 hypothetical protein [Nocardia uniformis]
MRRHDLDALVSTLTADVLYRSPVMYCELAGPDVMEFMGVFFDAVSEITDIHEYGNDQILILLAAVTARDRCGSATWVLYLDDHRQVRRITWQVRPFSLALRLSDTFATALARRHHRPGPVAIPLTRWPATTLDLLAPLLPRKR